jgi:hypothetical protein
MDELRVESLVEDRVDGIVQAIHGEAQKLIASEGVVATENELVKLIGLRVAQRTGAVEVEEDSTG